MKVINTTDSDIEVKVKGTVYSVDANDSIGGVPEDHARYWKENLHGFLKIEKEGSQADTEVSDSDGYDTPSEEKEELSEPVSDESDDSEDEEEDENSILEDMTITELREKAEQLDLDVSSRSKQPYIDAIKESIE